MCIHRAPLSTHERLIGFLIEHYAGNFPVWIAPEQVRVIPITDSHVPYAEQINARLVDLGVRSKVDAAAERMNAKIRSAQLMKVPYMLVVGDQEAANDTVSLAEARRFAGRTAWRWISSSLWWPRRSRLGPAICRGAEQPPGRALALARCASQSAASAGWFSRVRFWKRKRAVPTNGLLFDTPLPLCYSSGSSLHRTMLRIAVTLRVLVPAVLRPQLI